MNGEKSISSNVLGHLPGDPRSSLQVELSRHIELYSERQLTDPLDALNALRGLFSSFSRDKRSIQQYWGLPVTPLGYGKNTRGLFRNRDISETTAKRLLLSSLAHGLTWCATTRRQLIRRDSFSSRAWSGWIGPITWAHSRPKFRLDEPNCLIDAHAVRTRRKTRSAHDDARKKHP
jgi:hypothetical protein